MRATIKPEISVVTTHFGCRFEFPYGLCLRNELSWPSWVAAYTVWYRSTPPSVFGRGLNQASVFQLLASAPVIKLMSVSHIKCHRAASCVCLFRHDVCFCVSVCVCV